MTAWHGRHVGSCWAVDGGFVGWPHGIRETGGAVVEIEVVDIRKRMRIRRKGVGSMMKLEWWIHLH